MNLGLSWVTLDRSLTCLNLSFMPCHLGRINPLLVGFAVRAKGRRWSKGSGYPGAWYAVSGQ